jgi:nucleoside-diphosphate-sugar epimerase
MQEIIMQYLLFIIKKLNPDIIIHLAAVSHANKSNKDPHSTFDHSLRTLENTLDYAKKKKSH